MTPVDRPFACDLSDHLIRNDLRQRRRPVNQRALDLLIAATALEHRLTLVTRNTEEYDDIPNLQLYPVR